MDKFIICIACLVLFYIKNIPSLQVIPERAMVTYINKKYVYNASMYTNRHGRKSKYYINIEGTTLMTFGNNVSLNLIFLELQQNEYKRSFIEAHFKICDMLNSNDGLGIYVGSAFRNAGLVCPVPPSAIKLLNMSVPMDDFPNVWPFERCKINASLTLAPNGEVIATGDVFLHFKNKLQTG